MQIDNDRFRTLVEDFVTSDDSIGLSKQDLSKLINNHLKNDGYETMKGEQKESFNKIYNKYNDVKLNHAKQRLIEKPTPILEKLVKDLDLDFDKESNIVKLNESNANKIIEYLKKDYFPFAKYIYERFYNFFGNKIDIQNNRCDSLGIQSLLAILIEIDRDNSTQIWRYKYKRDSMYKLVNYISDPKNDFFKRLKDGVPSLPDELVDNCGTYTTSFSSKACTQLYEYLYMNKDDGNKYYKNDKYVRAVLPYYLDYYGVKHSYNRKNISKNTKYEELYKLLDELKNAATIKEGKEITREALDQILWFCYKSFKA